MRTSDVEANTGGICPLPKKMCAWKTIMKQLTAVVFILSIMFAYVAVQGGGGVGEMEEDTCPSGDQAPKTSLQKFMREFRRLVGASDKGKKHSTLIRVGVDAEGRTTVHNDQDVMVGHFTHNESKVKEHAFELEADSHEDVEEPSEGQSKEELESSGVRYIKVTIEKATGLPACDTRTWGVCWDKYDPYVKCVYTKPGKSSQQIQTPVLYAHQNPQWNYAMNIKYHAGGVLKCHLWDKDFWTSDDQGGDFTVQDAELTQIAAGKWFPLSKGGGKVRVKATLEATAQPTPQPTPKPTPRPTPAAQPTPRPTPVIAAQISVPFSWGCAHRMRKDWVDLTAPEKSLYMEAVNKIKTTPRKGETSAGPGKNIYDTFVMIHEHNVNKAYAHQTAGFLAWHRKYLVEFETALRTVDPKYACVTLPYWDWTSETWGCTAAGLAANTDLDQPSCENYHDSSALLKDFGGPGDATKTKATGSNTHGSSGSGAVGCLTTGPFKGWVDQYGKCLSRGVNWKIQDQKPFTGRIRMLEVLGYKDYGNQRNAKGFRVVLEGAPHGSTHNYLGGHMRSFISPADPIFWSHHTYIDKLWANWQDCHDYDTAAVKTSLTDNPKLASNKKYYEPTAGFQGDDVDDTMPFYMTKCGASPCREHPPSKCTKSETACATCVHDLDDWCITNDWDDTCKAQCSTAVSPGVTGCEIVCGMKRGAAVDMNAVGSDILKDWVTTDKTPASVISPHLMTQGTVKRSFSYSPDEIERSIMKNANAIMHGCKFDSHKASQAAHGVLAEAHDFHHTGTHRGHAAQAYGLMVAEAVKQVTDEISQDNKTLSEEQIRQALQGAQQAECKHMASKCKGDYKKEYICKTDQPRCLLPWMGSKTYHEIMADPVLKKAIMQDPCCVGDDASLVPGECVDKSKPATR